MTRDGEKEQRSEEGEGGDWSEAMVQKKRISLVRG